MSKNKGVLRRSLRACWSLFRIRVAEHLQYRAAVLASCSIGLFWGLLEIIVLAVFYQHGSHRQPDPNGLALAQAVSYVWLAQAFVPMTQMGVDGELLRTIVSGDVGVELIRPLDLYFHWFAKSAAGRLGALGWRLIITLVVALALPQAYRLQGPASAPGLMMSLVSFLCGFLLASAYGMLITAIRLGITWGEGPTNMLVLLGGVLSGGYFPLQLWPDALQGLLFWQPFAGYLDLPARLYVGSMDPGRAGLALAIQLGWTALFIALGRCLMGRKLRHLIVQGG